MPPNKENRTLRGPCQAKRTDREGVICGDDAYRSMRWMGKKIPVCEACHQMSWRNKTTGRPEARWFDRWGGPQLSDKQFDELLREYDPDKARRGEGPSLPDLARRYGVSYQAALRRIRAHRRERGLEGTGKEEQGKKRSSK